MRTEPRPLRRPSEAGLTLVELIVFIVIVSVGLVGILAVMNVAARHSADPLPTRQALAIAEAMLEEIQRAPFTWCDPDDAQFDTATSSAIGPTGCASLPEGIGPEAGDARPFDNVSDYHQPAPSAVTDVAGAPIALLADYRTSVSITPATLNTLSVASGDALLIAVTVTGPGNTSVTLEGYRARSAPNARP